MTPIESRTSTERILRALLLSLLVDVFAVMFLYDGYVGYARKNAAHLVALLGLQTDPPSSNPELSAQRGQRLAESSPISLEKLSAELGPPAIRQSDAAYFVGTGGWLRVDLKGDVATAAKWINGPHTESDQKLQQWIGWLLVVVGFAATLNLGRVLATRARLSDEGLSVTGRPLIPFEAMTGLRPSGTASGTSVLEFALNGTTGTVQLDPYTYKNAPAISKTIAERRGFSSASSS